MPVAVYACDGNFDRIWPVLGSGKKYHGLCCILLGLKCGQVRGRGWGGGKSFGLKSE